MNGLNIGVDLKNANGTKILLKNNSGLIVSLALKEYFLGNCLESIMNIACSMDRLRLIRHKKLIGNNLKMHL